MDLMLLKEGFIVMVIGMGTVFMFLTVMIWAMSLNEKVLKVVNKYFPEEIPEIKKPQKKKTAGSDEEIALAIACAVAASRG